MLRKHYFLFLSIMNCLEFKKNQLQKVNKSIEALDGYVHIPNELVLKKLILEQDISEIESEYEKIRNKVFDSQLVKE